MDIIQIITIFAAKFVYFKAIVKKDCVTSANAKHARKGGRKPLLESCEALADAWLKYRNKRDADRFIVEESTSVKTGHSITERPMPYDLNAFARGIGYASWNSINRKYSHKKGFDDVVQQIRDDWEFRWLILGATGAANPMIACRILRLSDKQEVQHEGNVSVKAEKQVTDAEAKSTFKALCEEIGYKPK